jgi:hypothetical protein
MKLKKLKQPPKTVKELKVQIAIGSLHPEKALKLFWIVKNKDLKGAVRKFAAKELKSMYPTTKWLNNSLDNSLLA